jgi:type I restriction-modification system DNA methylase subunit
MSIFQKSVLNKYLSNLDQEAVDSAFEVFKQNYSETKIEEIKSIKEEAYQDGFLRDIFVDVLGYIIKPDDGYNLTREFKNLTDSKKADGAILRDGKAIAVIELKSNKTTDLKSIEQQAFNYKNNQPDCKYVITSNFHRLRLYIDNTTEYEEFDLFELKREEFEIFYLILNKDSIFTDIPAEIKKDTVFHEENISKQLYKDYSIFKNKLFENLVKNHPEIDKLTLFKKSQKLVDRFLFILFSEDRGLLPPNSISRIIDNFKTLDDLDAYKPLYEVYKQYFGYMNIGRPGKKSAADDIPAYNGGLFYPDPMLDELKIDDEVLVDDLMKLSAYDFNTEIDVDILGHIFEHSLAEIEEITAEIEGVTVDKKKSKRKKDGVFYTPKYITQYIVENTIGVLCSQKRADLNIDKIEIDDSYHTKKGKLAPKGQKLHQALEQYKEWLLLLKIVDPACGSGAFLNQALNFLIGEHNFIIDIQTELQHGQISIFNIETTVLENNLYGVDINEESVEIAKLSLWLRTAKRGRKLTILSNNIKCGNSLIDDPAIAGDKAFDWEKEFPEVFKKGGFDVVIGNPPYVNANELKKKLEKEEYNYLKKQYETAKGTVDLYIYFFEKGLNILNKNGFLSYITPNRYLSASYGKALREILIENYEIVSLIDYSDKKVFEDASTYPVISFFRKTKNIDYRILTGKFEDTSKELISSNFHSSKLKILDDSILGFLLNDKLTITEKIISISESLEKVGKINATSTAKEADEYSSLINELDGFKLINTGTIDPFVTEWGNTKLTDKGKKYKRPYLPFENDLISSNRTELYKSPKIIIAKIGLQCEAFYDEFGEYASINTNCIHTFTSDYQAEYILCWINSKLYNYMFECFFDGLRMSGGYLLYSAPNLRNTYIKNISIEEQKPFVERAKSIQAIKKQLVAKIEEFLGLIGDNFNIEKPSKKLKNFYKYEFNTILTELEKLGTTLDLVVQGKWKVFFRQCKSEIVGLQLKVSEIEKQNNQEFYKIFGLSDDEVQIVENSF